MPTTGKTPKPSQEEILDATKELLGPYAKKLVNKSTKPGCTELYSVKPVEALGKKRDEMFFAAVMPMKAYVGFYFMPIYTHASEFKDLDPSLRKLLKGKSCFHIKTIDQEVNKRLSALLKRGYDLYKKIGWI